MSSSEFARGRCADLFAFGLAVAILGLQGCQVRPLYAAYDSPQTKLASISIDPVGDRIAQQVRNHLVFLLDHGAGQPAFPDYTLALAVSSEQIGVFSGSSVDSSPTAGKDRVTVGYVLKDAKTGEPVKSGRRLAVASYDLPPQEFTRLRAVRDAENRAAVSAAELVGADLAGYLAR